MKKEETIYPSSKKEITVEETKEWIDNATIKELLYKLKNKERDPSWFTSTELGNHLTNRIMKLSKEDYDAYIAACIDIWAL